MGLHSCGSGQQQALDVCEQCNELSGPIKSRNLLEQLSNYSFRNKYSASWSKLVNFHVDGSISKDKKFMKYIISRFHTGGYELFNLLGYSGCFVQCFGGTWLLVLQGQCGN